MAKKKLDKKIFSKGMALIAADYKQDYTKSYLSVAYELMSHLSQQEFEYAIRVILSDRQEIYPGTNIVAVILDAVKKINQGERPSAEEAWGIVLEEVSSKGAHGVPKFDSEVITAAVKAMGWTDLCYSEVGDNTIRAHFYRTYEACQKREELEETTKRITGLGVKDFMAKLTGKVRLKSIK